jgi:DNA-binding NarL/FixJ family response regulator
MQTVEMKAGLGADGFLLLDESMNPIVANPIAIQILAYPQKAELEKDLDSYILKKIRSDLVDRQSNSAMALVSRFQSGRRSYSCRSFPVSSVKNGHPQASLAVILERSSARSALLAQSFDRFNLTAREQEVARFLLHGLTSKEIGTRMQISPNTVKAFLRLIMVKMGVSTRSAIVGKALTADPVNFGVPSK